MGEKPHTSGAALSPWLTFAFVTVPEKEYHFLSELVLSAAWLKMGHLYLGPDQAQDLIIITKKFHSQESHITLRNREDVVAHIQPSSETCRVIDNTVMQL